MTNNTMVSKQGFTLVELSIVIVIIGFLIAGVSAGQSLIAQARLNKVINELQQYDIAVSIFENQYGAIPGDMSNATSYWPTAVNGNGNGYINLAGGWDIGPEAYGAWQHLSLAGLVSGKYSGTDEGNSTFSPGINVPTSAYNQAVYSIISNGDWDAYDGVATKIYIVKQDSDPWDTSAWHVFGVVDSANVDQKVDDGNPFLGKVIAWSDAGSTSSCVNYDLRTHNIPSNPRYVIENGNVTQCVVEFGLLGYAAKGLGS